MSNLDWVRYANGHTPTADLRLRMQKCMQTNAAVFRTAETLQEGCKQMDAIYKELKDLKVCFFNSGKHLCGLLLMLNSVLNVSD